MADTSRQNRRANSLASIFLVLAYGTLWRMGLLFLCVPLYVVGIFMIRAGYFSIDVSNAIRDALERGGDKLEQRI